MLPQTPITGADNLPDGDLEQKRRSLSIDQNHAGVTILKEEEI